MSDPLPHRVLVLDARASGRRVDTYLSARFSLWSRSEIARCIRQGQVRRDGRPLRPSSILREGDRLEVRVPGIAPESPPPPLPPILYEDDVLFILDKPAGLLAHPVGQRFVYGVINVARSARPDARIDLVHRLDRDTSGVLVLTKDRAANAFLKERLKRREGFVKEYLAVVRGVPAWDTRKIDAPLGSATDSGVRLKQGVRPDGLAARTTVTVLARLQDHALVRCGLHTGRNHQIRVHLDHVGHPLLGDRLYGQPDEVFLACIEGRIDQRIRAAVRFPRQALHAERLTLPHPTRGEPVTVRAPIPADLRAVIEGAEPSWPDSPPVARPR